VDQDMLERDAFIFPVKDALLYIPRSRLRGSKGRGSQGASFFAAPNPPFGAVITYHLREKPKTLLEKRKESEEANEKAGKPYRQPTMDELRAEEEEAAPRMLIVVRDDTGAVVRRIPAPRESGIHRVSWNLRYPSTSPVEIGEPGSPDPWSEPPSGYLALPGTYTASLVREVDGEVRELAGPVAFEVVPLALATFAAKDRKEVLRFQKKVARLHRAVEGSIRVARETRSRLAHIRQAIVETPGADVKLVVEAQKLEKKLGGILKRLQGDRTLAKYQEPVPPSIRSRVRSIVGSQWGTTSAPTQTQRDGYRHAAEEFEKVLAELRSLVERDVASIETKLEAAGAPWTPGRIPRWKKES
jgi:hypothetical protein